MRPFIPVLLFAAITFPMLAVWNEFSGAALDLRPWLYLVNAFSWVVAFAITALLFSPGLARRRLRSNSSIVLAITAIAIFYPCRGFLTAHAEEHVIQQRRSSGREPGDMGFTYMYAEFSGSGYSRGALDAGRGLTTGLQHALISAFIWCPIVFFGARRLYRHTAPHPIHREVS